LKSRKEEPVEEITKEITETKKKKVPKQKGRKHSQDDIIKQLLEAEISKTELEKYEKLDFDEQEKKPTKPGFENLLPIKIERKEQQPTKVTIIDAAQVPQQIKLKASKRRDAPEISSVTIPGFRLKSKIEYVEMPKPEKPKLKEIGSIRQQGELSRNMKEAEKELEKYYKKFKPSKKTKKNLEKVESMEFEPSEKKIEVVDEKIEEPEIAPEKEEIKIKEKKTPKEKKVKPKEEEEHIITLTEEIPKQEEFKENEIKVKEHEEHKTAEAVVSEQIPVKELPKEETVIEEIVEEKPKEFIQEIPVEEKKPKQKKPVEKIKQKVPKEDKVKIESEQPEEQPKAQIEVNEEQEIEKPIEVLEEIKPYDITVVETEEPDYPDLQVKVVDFVERDHEYEEVIEELVLTKKRNLKKLKKHQLNRR